MHGLINDDRLFEFLNSEQWDSKEISATLAKFEPQFKHNSS